LSLTANHDISDSSYVTADILLEEQEHGFEVHIERFKITKSFDKILDVSAGRFYKPLGFWKHNFHHGSLYQDTVSRPFFLEFENRDEGVFPAHLVGLLLGRETNLYSLQFAASNSTGLDTVDYDEEEPPFTQSINTSDPSKDKTYVLRATVSPLKNRLEFGILGIMNNVVEIGEHGSVSDPLVEHGETLFDQQVLGVDLSYNGTRFYTFGEYYHMNFEDNPDMSTAGSIAPNAESYQAQAYYLQMGYRFTTKFTIAIRHENLDFEENSTYFDIQGIIPETRNLVAFNYRIEESNIVRFEIRDEKPDQLDSTLYYNLQWFFYIL